MKKSSLLKMKNLPATEEMLAVAREDVPVKVGSGWNTSYRCRYSGFVRSAVSAIRSFPMWRRIWIGTAAPERRSFLPDARAADSLPVSIRPKTL